MQSSCDVHLLCECDIFFLQELLKLMNRDCYADRCDDQISFFPFQREISALFRREKYSGQLHDGIT